jgi:putative cell wall-binding protein
MLITDSGNVQADVVWDVAVCPYDEANKDAQTFTVEGTVILPDSVDNPSNIPLAVSISVSVNAATAVPKTLISITPPQAVTGLANGTEKTAAALGLPPTVTLITDQGEVAAGVTWNVAASLYDPSDSNEQTFEVSGNVALPIDVFNTAGVALDVTVSVTVNAQAAIYTITASAGNGGSISPSGAVSVPEGGSQTFAVTPNSNYSIASVTVDGINQGALTAYTFDKVTSDHTISVTFSYSGGSSSGGGGGGPQSPALPAETSQLTTGQLQDLVNSNQPLNLDCQGLGLSIAPSALSGLISPESGGEGDIKLVVSPVTDPAALNTFFIQYPGQQGIMKGYSVTLTRESNGQTESISELNGEITLTFEFTPEELAGLDPSTLVVYKQGDDGSVTELSGEFDWQTNSLSVSTNHLCQFYIMGQAGIPAQRLAGNNRYATAAAISAQGWQRADNVVLVSGENFPDALAGTALAAALDAPVLLTARNSLNSETLTEIRRLQAKKIWILGGSGVITGQVEEMLARDYTVTRIAGASRFETAVKIGQAVLAAQSGGTRQGSRADSSTVLAADTVILATGFNYPDVLSVAPWAGQYGLPILFTEKESLHNLTEQALQEWSCKRVIICGGTGAISEQVESFLHNKMGLAVTRLSGADRYQTGLALARYFAGNGTGTVSGNGQVSFKYAALATGENFPDALAGAALAAKLKMPVLLSGKDQVKPELKDYLQGLSLEKFYFIGGQAVLPDKVKEEIAYPSRK